MKFTAMEITPQGMKPASPETMRMLNGIFGANEPQTKPTSAEVRNTIKKCRIAITNGGITDEQIYKVMDLVAEYIDPSILPPALMAEIYKKISDAATSGKDDNETVVSTMEEVLNLLDQHQESQTKDPEIQLLEELLAAARFESIKGISTKKELIKLILEIQKQIYGGVPVPESSLFDFILKIRGANHGDPKFIDVLADFIEEIKKAKQKTIPLKTNDVQAEVDELLAMMSSTSKMGEELKKVKEELGDEAVKEVAKAVVSGTPLDISRIEKFKNLGPETKKVATILAQLMMMSSAKNNPLVDSSILGPKMEEGLITELVAVLKDIDVAMVEPSDPSINLIRKAVQRFSVKEAGPGQLSDDEVIETFNSIMVAGLTTKISGPLYKVLHSRRGSEALGGWKVENLANELENLANTGDKKEFSKLRTVVKSAIKNHEAGSMGAIDLPADLINLVDLANRSRSRSGTEPAVPVELPAAQPLPSAAKHKCNCPNCDPWATINKFWETKLRGEELERELVEQFIKTRDLKGKPHRAQIVLSVDSSDPIIATRQLAELLELAAHQLNFLMDSKEKGIDKYFLLKLMDTSGGAPLLDHEEILKLGDKAPDGRKAVELNSTISLTKLR